METALNELERRLDPAIFFRISRSVIVNLDHVAEVVMTEEGYGDALLKTGVRLQVSRRRLKTLLDKLDGTR
jgi:two-component system LytT family response regulator